MAQFPGTPPEPLGPHPRPPGPGGGRPGPGRRRRARGHRGHRRTHRRGAGGGGPAPRPALQPGPRRPVPARVELQGGDVGGPGRRRSPSRDHRLLRADGHHRRQAVQELRGRVVRLDPLPGRLRPLVQHRLRDPGRRQAVRRRPRRCRRALRLRRRVRRRRGRGGRRVPRPQRRRRPGRLGHRPGTGAGQPPAHGLGGGGGRVGDVAGAPHHRPAVDRGARRR